MLGKGGRGRLREIKLRRPGSVALRQYSGAAARRERKRTRSAAQPSASKRGARLARSASGRQQQRRQRPRRPPASGAWPRHGSVLRTAGRRPSSS